MGKNLLCPICQKKGIRINKVTYAFTRYRCVYCKVEYHSERGYKEGLTTNWKGEKNE